MGFCSIYVSYRFTNPWKWLVFAGFFVFLCAPQTTKADDGKQELIEAFFKDLINVNIATENLIAKYMCVDTSSNKDKEMRALLDQQMYRLRMKMLGQSKKITDNFGQYIKSYRELPENDQNILMNKKDEGNVFSFKGEQNISVLLLVDKGKILSFTVTGKGSARAFQIICG